MRQSIKKIILTISISISLFASAKADFKTDSLAIMQRESWVDSVYNSLSENQRLGQLFMIAAYSNKSKKHVNNIKSLIHKYNLGGLIFFKGGPVRQAALTNYYQKRAKTPLFIAIDGEWGLNMRLDSTIQFPQQMELGAIQDNNLIYEFGAEVARQCKRMGIHINFAPVVDINSNPENPVIGMRSFGENKIKVAQKGLAYVKGLQDNNVIANAKHFPGHGDTDSDSHKTLPTINHSIERLENVELYPFKFLIDRGVQSMMVAHLHVPAYDSVPNRAATLSRRIVTDLLKGELGYTGLVFTDALNMKGVSYYNKPGEVDLHALKAGNDVLLFSEDVPKAVDRIKRAMKYNWRFEAQVEVSIRKILRAKYNIGLNEYKPVKLQGLIEDLNQTEVEQLRYKLYEHTITVLKDEDKLIPIKYPDLYKTASLSIRTNDASEFQKGLDLFSEFDHYSIKDESKQPKYYIDLLNKLKQYDLVVIGVHGMNNSSRRKYGLETMDLHLIKTLQADPTTKVIVNVYGNPYSLKYFDGIKNIMITYKDKDAIQKIVPRVIFGTCTANGRLPVTASEEYQEDMGIDTKGIERLDYGVAEDVGIDYKTLQGIDKIAEEALKIKATPGCQILVAKAGKIVYHKGFGHYTYQKEIPVNKNTVYDIASITKVASTLEAFMFLEERGSVSLNKKIFHYLPELKKTNKRNLKLKDILTHQAGLQPYLAYWKRTVKNGNDSIFYTATPDSLHHIYIRDSMYVINSINDSIWQWTIDSELMEKEEGKKKKDPYQYKYSDLGFHITHQIVEKYLNQPIDEFMRQNFYEPLGAYSLGYNPHSSMDIKDIPPTEIDSFFRMSRIQGYVNDQTAALMNGIGGHAGLFSNSLDLAKLLQMNLQDGVYAGTRYLQKGTTERYSKKYYQDNRRGLGWDKPNLGKFYGPTSIYASPHAYGHTGFTGVTAWVDPEFDLVYIFLSNRTFPNASNTSLVKYDIRTRIMDIIYKAIFEYEKTETY